MRIMITDASDLARLAADEVTDLLRRAPDAVLGLATGSSPLRLYDELARRHAEEGLSFARARAFLLDEYVGLPADHPERYAAVIESALGSRVDFAPGAVRGPDGGAADLDAACVAYEEAIRAAGGVDLQVLGIGSNGHVAFNEPGSPLESRTRVVDLTAQTRADNARFFGGDVDAVPRRALSQGLGTIMSARHLVLIATGGVKAEAVRAMLEGPVDTECPASVLQRHPRVTVLLDHDAAVLLEGADAPASRPRG